MKLNRASHTGVRGWVGWGTMACPLFAQKKNGRQRQKRKGFKTETFKRLSRRSKYHCFSHSRASRIRKLFWSANHVVDNTFQCSMATPTLKSISPPLLKMKNCNTILTEKQQKYQNYHLEQLRNMYVLVLEKYYLLIKEE